MLTKAIPDICTRPSIFLLLSRILFGAFLILADTLRGWATYAEMMSYYLASLPKTEASLLQKNSSVILGLYALADMGIHYDGWSVTDTVRFFSDYGINDPNAVQSVYKLIIGSPANYLKYYIGYLKFYELKRRWQMPWEINSPRKNFTGRYLLDNGAGTIWRSYMMRWKKFIRLILFHTK